MQLKPEATALRRRLMVASCALLGASAARAQETSGKGLVDELLQWQLQSALSYYHEDGRIQAIEPVVNVSRDLSDGGKLAFDGTFDALSGSSPNGALTSRTPNTFASPSAKSFSSARHLYTVGSGQLPVDPNYSDARFAGGAQWTLPLTRLTRTTVGGKFSYEDDFYSLSLNASLEHDFNEKNTTVSIGINDENDAIRPIGGTPVALSNYALFQKTGNQSKNGAGALVGLTQVMSRHWLTDLSLSVDRFSGYLNDPYKIASIVDPNGDTTGYLYENRPGSRTRRSVYWENRVGGNRSSATVSVRYMRDNWGIGSETAQLRIRVWNGPKDQYLEPTVRWYRQTAADFYKAWIPISEATDLSYVSSDYRLGAFHAFTYGVKYGMSLSDRFGRQNAEFTVRAEYYRQTMEDRMAGPGSLQGLNLYPGLQ
ncbi:MAG: DUF3570 domain-containing protein, partial [Candidatus Dormibacteraceae bacterium]